MGTPGNLELRIGKQYERAATDFDGSDVYAAIPRFAALLEQIRNPTHEQFSNWFHTACKELLLTLYNEYIPHAPHHVIIDPKRRIISHTAKNVDLRERSDESLSDAFRQLKSIHQYTIVRRSRGI